MMTKTLDIGCGATPRNPFNALEVFGIDTRIIDGSNIIQCDAVFDPFPFEDGSFDFVTCYDFIEHIPRVVSFKDTNGKFITLNCFVEFMNKVYNVLKRGGYFFSSTPAFPHPEAFQDPTHVNIITERTFPLYFNDQYPVAHVYGFKGAFKVIDQHWEGHNLATLMQKNDPPNLAAYERY